MVSLPLVFWTSHRGVFATWICSCKCCTEDHNLAAATLERRNVWSLQLSSQVNGQLHGLKQNALVYTLEKKKMFNPPKMEVDGFLDDFPFRVGDDFYRVSSKKSRGCQWEFHVTLPFYPSPINSENRWIKTPTSPVGIPLVKPPLLEHSWPAFERTPGCQGVAKLPAKPRISRILCRDVCFCAFCIQHMYMYIHTYNPIYFMIVLCKHIQSFIGGVHGVYAHTCICMAAYLDIMNLEPIVLKQKSRKLVAERFQHDQGTIA